MSSIQVILPAIVLCAAILSASGDKIEVHLPGPLMKHEVDANEGAALVLLQREGKFPAGSSFELKCSFGAQMKVIARAHALEAVRYFPSVTTVASVGDATAVVLCVLLEKDGEEPSKLVCFAVLSGETYALSTYRHGWNPNRERVGTHVFEYDRSDPKDNRLRELMQKTLDSAARLDDHTVTPIDQFIYTYFTSNAS